MKNLHFEEVRTLFHAEALRRIRNACREFMTRDTRKIGFEQQIIWYRSNRKKYRLFLCYVSVDRSIITLAGYGLVRADDDRVTVSGGLLPQFRGFGLGAQLFGFLINQRKDSTIVLLEVLEKNIPALRTYEALGFTIKRKIGEGVIEMVLDR